MSRELTMNRMVNARNEYQTNAKRVLCVCSAGLLRSPTMANVLWEGYGYNTRSCGADEAYALIPLDEVLIHWAHEIVFANLEVMDDAVMKFGDALSRKRLVPLKLPDSYEWNAPELRLAILDQYSDALTRIEQIANEGM